MTTRPDEPDTQELVERASRGDDRARQALLIRYYERLLRMAAVRLDRRLAPRVDPADVLQWAVLEASQGPSAYFRTRPLPYHAWLRQYMGERSRSLHRHHFAARRRGPYLTIRSGDSVADSLDGNPG